MFRDLLLLMSGVLLADSESSVGKGVGAALIASGIIRLTDRVDGMQPAAPGTE